MSSETTAVAVQYRIVAVMYLADAIQGIIAIAHLPSLLYRYCT